MPALAPGNVIKVSDGSSLTIVAYIASGGQGEVYKVHRKPEDDFLALKWYTNDTILRSNRFRQTLSALCSRKAPSDTFLWPIAITERFRGGYGYVMRLRPDEYIDLGKYFCIDENPDAYFRSNLAKLTAGLQICDAFSRLHQSGYSYQDINDGSFLIDPHKGRVLICDNDNIVPDGQSNGIAGKPHYMAPEVADGRHPDKASDRFSLAIILYRIFMVDHPFEGALTSTDREGCLTPEDEILAFGRKAVFCHDATDSSNPPVRGLHDNSILFWKQMTPALKHAFRTTLSQKAISDPRQRLRAASWKEILLAERASLATCTCDGLVHDYLCHGNMPAECPICGSAPGLSAWLTFGDSAPSYRLTDHKPLFLGNSSVPTGVCYTTKVAGSDRLVLVNKSVSPWTAVLPSGRCLAVPPQSNCIITDGMSLLMGSFLAKVRI